MTNIIYFVIYCQQINLNYRVYWVFYYVVSGLHPIELAAELGESVKIEGFALQMICCGYPRLKPQTGNGARPPIPTGSWVPLW